MLRTFVLVTILAAGIIASLPLYADDEPIVKEIEKEAEKVEKRLEQKDRPCGWQYYENGVRSGEPVAKLPNSAFENHTGYYQCEGSCKNGRCYGHKSPADATSWLCDCSPV